MLVLSRKTGEKVMIGTNSEVIVQVLEVQVHRQRVRLGITAPKEVPVHREEIWVQLQNAKERQ